jgi:hypothetical protein
MKTAITSILIVSSLTGLLLMASFRSASAQSVKVENIMNTFLATHRIPEIPLYVNRTFWLLIRFSSRTPPVPQIALSIYMPL